MNGGHAARFSIPATAKSLHSSSLNRSLPTQDMPIDSLRTVLR
jgi:hypothetical protein